MTLLRLALRGLAFHRRAHLGTFLGTAAAAAVLSGALFTGDSVRETLLATALMRLGETRWALGGEGRHLRAGLADRLGPQSGGPVAPVLSLRGVAIKAGDPKGDGERQVGGVRVLGVDGRFAGLVPAREGGGEGGGFPLPASGEALLGELLARELGVKAGEEISLRVPRPSPLSRDAPLSSRRGDATARRAFRVKAVLEDGQMGRFALEADMGVPQNAFVPLADLQEAAGLPGRANLFLSGSGEPKGESGWDQARAGMDAALARAFLFEDAGLFLGREGNAVLSLASEGIFLPPAADALLSFPGAVGSLTYLADSLTPGGGVGRAAYYPLVAALSPDPSGLLSPVPAGMRDDEILLHPRLADAPGAEPGAWIVLSWREREAKGGWAARSRRFRVRGALPRAALARERALAPGFPGITEVSTCRDWDIGMPLDPERLRDPALESYWREWGPTPQAVVTLAAGREMWGSGFGDLTGIRFPAEGPDPAPALRAALAPRTLGISFRPVRQEALRAAREGVDLGGLFAGMSAFLLAAALLFSGTLFAFEVQRRGEEVGTLLALGAGRLRSVLPLAAEGAGIAAAGSLAGTALGLGWTAFLVALLSRPFRGAVAGTPVAFHPHLSTACLSALLAFLASALCLGGTAFFASRRQVRELLAGDPSGGPAERATPSFARGGWQPRAALVLLLGAAGVLLAPAGEGSGAGRFFSAGALLLAGGSFAASALLGRAGFPGGKRPRLSLPSLGLRNAGRRRGRSLAAILLLAGGSFTVFAVSALQEDPLPGSRARGSGTGGFALWGETTLPLLREPGSAGGAVGAGDLAPFGEAVLVKARDGDDASCLNLNRAPSPRLLGVDPGEFSRRGAFLAKGGGDPWALLRSPRGDGTIPALAGDADTARWNLGLRAGEDGDVLITRGGDGREARIRLVGTLPQRRTVFSGSLLMDSARFERLFPAEEGYRLFLLDVPQGREEAARLALLGRLARLGPRLVGTARRLAAFDEVEGSYRRMFLLLGGLGLILGTLGLGVVVLRNVMERRAELALLRAVGFSRGRVVLLVAAEHAALLAGGLLLGLVSGAVAALPALGGRAGGILLAPLAILFLALFAFGLAATILASRLSISGDPLPALRNE